MFIYYLQIKYIKNNYIFNIMEKNNNSEEDIYISRSKLNIDNFIRKNEYRKAFGLLILFLERLNDTEKTEIVDYYSKNMQKLGIFNNTFPSR
jgi:hypothetical protein